MGGTPESSIYIEGFSIINQPFSGMYPHLWKPGWHLLQGFRGAINVNDGLLSCQPSCLGRRHGNIANHYKTTTSRWGDVEGHAGVCVYMYICIYIYIDIRSTYVNNYIIIIIIIIIYVCMYV